MPLPSIPLEHAGPRLVCSLVVALLALTCSPGAEERSDSDDDETYAGRTLEDPVPKPDITLNRVSDGRPFDFRERTEGTLTLLFLGYTHCPDVCPVHMANLAAVLRDLPLEVRREIRVVFVSTDPRRDTPERIREWLDGFDPAFIGLRGTRSEIAALEDALGVPRSVVDGAGEAGSGPPGRGPEGESDDYFVGHAAQVLAFERDDTARVAYPWGTRQRDWLRDLPRLVSRDAPDGA